MDARKTIKMAQIMQRNVLGIIENMSGFKCPHCSKEIDLYPPGGAEKAAKDFNIELLGKIPFDINVSIQGDKGLPFIIKHVNNENSKSFKEIINKIQKILEK